jgi:hypothetical protein
MPSTMRDEIRLMRILIQYCDTTNEAVLMELKEWFGGMNEVQRVCMARSLRELAQDSRHIGSGYLGRSNVSDPKEQYRADFIFPMLCEIYKMVREYDVEPITKDHKAYLRDLGLIE